MKSASMKSFLQTQKCHFFFTQELSPVTRDFVCVCVRLHQSAFSFKLCTKQNKPNLEWYQSETNRLKNPEGTKAQKMADVGTVSHPSHQQANRLLYNRKHVEPIVLLP